MNFDFSKEMEKQINLCKKVSFEATQKALVSTGQKTVKIMANATFTNGMGLFKNSWDVIKYPNAIYVYNSRGVLGKNKGIPISNLSEYASRGPGAFILSTFEKNKHLIFTTFQKEMKQNLRRI